MRFISIIIVIAVLSIALLGFLPMNHAAHHGVSDSSPCPITLLLNALCSSGSFMGPAHILALYSFSNVPIVAMFLLFFLLIAFGLSICAWLFVCHVVHAHHDFNKNTRAACAIPILSFGEKEWLALCVNSPTSA